MQILQTNNFRCSVKKLHKSQQKLLDMALGTHENFYRDLKKAK